MIQFMFRSQNKAPTSKRQAVSAPNTEQSPMAIPNFVRALLDRPVAYHRCLAELTGGVAAGLLLSQAIYWTLRTKDPDGWFYKCRDDWQDELGLTRTDQENARQKLRRFDFWQEEKRGVPATLHYRVDLDLLTAALSGQYADVTLEQVITLYAATLKQLSKAGYMRARKAKAIYEYVDYAEVLQFKGMSCGICGKKIIRPIGQKPNFLTFDHIIALGKGGSHTFKNLQPVHVGCSTNKNTGLNNFQSAYTKPTESAYTKPANRLTRNQQVGLRKPDKSAYTNPTLPYKAENTQVITAKKKQKRARANGTAAAAAARSRFAETLILDYLEATKPNNQHRNAGLAHKLYLTGEDDHLIERWQQKQAAKALPPAQDDLRPALELADVLLSRQQLDEREKQWVPDLITQLATRPDLAGTVAQLRGLL